MRNGFHFVAIAALFAMPLASCDCESTTIKADAKIEVAPAAGTFGTVCNDSSTTRSFTITNAGLGTLNANLAIEGADASFFSVTPATVSIGVSGGTEKVTVTYKPTGDVLGKGHAASLVITSNGSEEPLKRNLGGDVADVLPQPILTFSCADSLPFRDGAEGDPYCDTICERSGDDAACLEQRRRTTRLDFGEPNFDSEIVTVQARVANLGCGSLEVTDVILEREFSDDCEPTPSEEAGGEPVEQVRVKDFVPFSLAGTVDPLEADAQEIEFEFTPVRSSCNVQRKFILVTNDPMADPEDPTGVTKATGNLSGRSTESLLIITPSLLSFGSVPTGEHKDSDDFPLARDHLQIRNASPHQVTIQRVELVPTSGPEGIFTIIDTKKCGESMGTNPTEIPMAKSSGKGDTCEDRFELNIRYEPGTSVGNHRAEFRVYHDGGVTKSTFSGNSKSKLEFYPDRITFGAEEPKDASEPRICSEDGNTCLTSDCNRSCTDDDHCRSGEHCVQGLCSDSLLCVPSCGASSRPLEICNEGVANLQIGKLEVFGDMQKAPAPKDSDGTPIFALKHACDDRMLVPGACCEETVYFDDSRVGGISSAVILVGNDDPDWSTTERFVDLYSSTTAAGRTPYAHIKALEGFPKARSWITFDGRGSSVEIGALTKFEWSFKTTQTSSQIPDQTIDPLNPNANCPASNNGGNCFKLSEGGQVLEFWPGQAGLTHTVTLKVTSSLCSPPQVSNGVSESVTPGDPT